MSTITPIPLYEDASDPTGTFTDYDTYDAGQLAQLPLQRHVDIRSFIQSSIAVSYTMFALDGLPMSVLDGFTIGDLETADVVVQGEDWTVATATMSFLDTLEMGDLDGDAMSELDTSGGSVVGVVGVQADRHNFNGITLDCTAGTVAVQSVLITEPINLTAFAPSDYISLALPTFPAADITQAATFIDFSSDPTGAFSVGQTVSLAFSTSATTLTATDCEARFPLSTLASINVAAITGVRLRITATAICSFRCLAIRCLAATWEFAPIDQNTLYERVCATVPPTGTATPVYTFPEVTVPADELLPSTSLYPSTTLYPVDAPPTPPLDWPVLLFASDSAGDPSLVDITLGAIINTGGRSGDNALVIYLRELALITTTIGSLDSMPMSALDASIPDATPGHLDDFPNTKFTAITYQWGASPTIAISDQDGNGYTYGSPTLTAFTSYYALTRLYGLTVTVALYPLSATGVPDMTAPVFGPIAITDPTIIPRRSGRVGWYAHLEDGAAYITEIRPVRSVYAEYQSLPLLSETPVIGARLYTGSSPDVGLFTGPPLPVNGSTVALDVIKSRSGQNYRVICPGLAPGEGIGTQTIRFENLADTEITFNVFATTPVRLVALLYGEHRLTVLPLQPFAASAWTQMTVPLAPIAQSLTPGSYRLLIVQEATIQSTWYIDLLSVHTKAVAWSGRGQAADPFGLSDPAWITFADTINSPYSGALLGRGNALQIRGQLLTQTAVFGSLQVLPQYATLGNLVWDDDD